MLNDFIKEWTGRPVDTDGAYPNQCMDLMHEYLKDVLGLPTSMLGAPAAKDVYINFAKMNGRDNFIQIDNTPSNVPMAGDIMFWGTAVGQYGHVAIFVSGDSNSFTSFDANWPVGSLPHLQAHNYSGVLGWLRPKKQPIINQPNMSENDTVVRTIRENLKINEFRIEGQPTVYQIFAIPDTHWFEDILGNKWENIRLLPSDWPVDPALWGDQRNYLLGQLNSANYVTKQLTDDLAATREDLSNTKKDRDAFKILSESKTQTVTEREATISDLQSKLAELHASVDQVVTANKDLIAQNKMLRSQLAGIPNNPKPAPQTIQSLIVSLYKLVTKKK